MSTNSAATIASVITVLSLLVAGAVILLGQLVALNDISESDGFISLGISLVGQFIGLVVSTRTAIRWTRRFIEKNNLNPTLAMIGASFAAICLGLVIAIASVVLSVVIVFVL